MFVIFSAGEPWNVPGHPDYAPCVNLPGNNPVDEHVKAGKDLSRCYRCYCSFACRVAVCSCVISVMKSGFRKTRFKQPNPLCFIGFGALWVFRIFFYLNEQLGSLLVDVAHQLSFYLDLSVL